MRLAGYKKVDTVMEVIVEICGDGCSGEHPQTKHLQSVYCLSSSDCGFEE